MVTRISRSRDTAHLSKVRGQPCLICADPRTIAHHVTFTDEPAMSLKVCDYNTVPLCHAHHMELHDHGNEEQWWALQGVDPIKFIEKVTND